MNPLRLETAAADAAGASLGLAHDRGFGLVSPGRDYLEPEDLVLAVADACRRAVSYLGATRDGPLRLGEGLGCDRRFDVTPAAIFPTTPGRDAPSRLSPKPDTRSARGRAPKSRTGHRVRARLPPRSAGRLNPA